MSSYLVGTPCVCIYAEPTDDDDFPVNPSTVQLRIWRNTQLVATLTYPSDTYGGQAITRPSTGHYQFKLMAPPIAAWEYAWDTTGPVRLGEDGFSVRRRKH